jgi:hypothetical protein
VGVLPHLLAYLEQDNLWQSLVAAAPVTNYFDVKTVAPAWFTNGNLVARAQTRVKSFLCPSDDPYNHSTTDTGTGVYGLLAFNYVTNPTGGRMAGPEFVGVRFTGAGAATLGRTNYLGVAGYFGETGITDDAYKGVFTNRSAVRLGAIHDGTSNTLMFGEYLGDNDNGPRERSGCWMGAGVLPTAWGLVSERKVPGSPVWYTFSSKHAGIVQFCLCDGSVRGLRKPNIDTAPPAPSPASYLSLAFASGYQDGQVVDWNQIGN